jgi:lipopolysaccharide/colanic/teichoic acid biosynthesis glycosyltransferase
MTRRCIKPNIASFAQIWGYRGDTDMLERMKKRGEDDMQYINNWSSGSTSTFSSKPYRPCCATRQIR